MFEFDNSRKEGSKTLKYLIATALSFGSGFFGREGCYYRATDEFSMDGVAIRQSELGNGVSGSLKLHTLELDSKRQYLVKTDDRGNFKKIYRIERLTTKLDSKETRVSLLEFELVAGETRDVDVEYLK